MGIFSNIYDGYLKVTNPQKLHALMASRHAISQFAYRNARTSRIREAKRNLGGTADQQAPATDLWTLRELSRDLDRNNIVAHSILDRICESTIGNGLNFSIATNGGGSRNWSEKVEDMVNKWWDNDADIRGIQTGFQMENTACRALKNDGDILVIKMRDGYQVQHVEADRIVTPSDKLNDPLVVNGVQLDSRGRHIGYWVSPPQTSNLNIISTFTSKSYASKDMEFVEAKDGMLLVNPSRFSQTRGVPTFANSLELFEDIDAYLEACILTAKIQASHSMVITTTSGGQFGIENSTAATNVDGDDYRDETIPVGRVMYLKPGEDAKGVSPTQPGPDFAAFFTQLMRLTGLSCGVPLEQLGLDFSQTNYSSGRLSMQVAYRARLQDFNIMFNRYKRPLIEWKVRGMMARGEVEKKEFFNVIGTPPKMTSVDPQKDTNAEVERMKHGITSLSAVCSMYGEDWTDVMEQRFVEIQTAQKYGKKLGISFRDFLGLDAPDEMQKPDAITKGSDDAVA